ncbi:MAG: MmgE/PrpD family protein [Rhodospirillaceae bacterium]|jgi:2-methylcitrate dehydratase PrpD
MADVTAHLAEFILSTAAEDIPAEAKTLGRKSILDSLAVSLSGSVAEGSQILRRYLLGFGCTGGTNVVFGTDMKLPAPLAVLANGAAMHADDYDDTLRARPMIDEFRGSTHPTTPVITALLAAAEKNGGATGNDVMTAYQIGVETAAKVNDTTGSRHFSAGYHPTATCCGIGAAAAVSRLFGSDLETTRMAIGIAASLASGLRKNFGSMMKPFHSGHTAKNGLMAAELAREGFTASPSVLDSPIGFPEAFGDILADENILERLGNPWSILDPGIWLKPHPSGMRTHQGMTKILELIAEHDLKADQIKTCHVKTHQGVYDTLIQHDPKTGLQGKFSFEFCAAVLFVEGRAGFAQFTDEVVNRADIRDMMSRMQYSAYSQQEFEENDYINATTLIDIELTDGKRISARADYGKGSNEIPMTFEDVIEKMNDCASAAQWPQNKLDAVIEAVSRFEELDDVRIITQNMSAA